MVHHFWKKCNEVLVLSWCKGASQKSVQSLFRVCSKFEVCSKFIIKTAERHQWRRSSFFNVNLGHISYLFLCLHC